MDKLFQIALVHCYFVYTNWRLFTFILGCFYARYGIFVQLIPSLNQIWFTWPIEIKGYKFLQHFSSLIGGLFILVWINYLPKENILPSEFDIAFWIKIVALTLFISIFRFLFFPIDIVLGNIIVVIGMSGFISLMIFGMIEKVRK